MPFYNYFTMVKEKHANNKIIAPIYKIKSGLLKIEKYVCSKSYKYRPNHYYSLIEYDASMKLVWCYL